MITKKELNWNKLTIPIIEKDIKKLAPESNKSRRTLYESNKYQTQNNIKYEGIIKKKTISKNQFGNKVLLANKNDIIVPKVIERSNLYVYIEKHLSLYDKKFKRRELPALTQEYIKSPSTTRKTNDKSSILLNKIIKRKNVNKQQTKSKDTTNRETCNNFHSDILWHEKNKEPTLKNNTENLVDRKSVV